MVKEVDTEVEGVLDAHGYAQERPGWRKNSVMVHEMELSRGRARKKEI